MTHKLKESEKGVILINKPVGITSFGVVARVRGRYFPGQKVGHTGTLDSMATGLLIILVGEATKRQGGFTRLPKEYEGEFALGVESDTYSADGRLRFPPQLGLLERLSSINKAEVEAVFKRFQGEQEQTVPPFSAVHVKGERLHRLARRRRPLPELPRRRINIERLELLDFCPFIQIAEQARPLQELGPEEFLNMAPRVGFRACVSSGTYVRSLVVDIGKELDTGAVLTRLTRTRIGPYKLSDAIDLPVLSF
ncbi:MAG: tRNA pseudouridine(55) synthase TruB [Planctomycetes bacterium]|nr:tRNA pseudouridine(55) synthase TruB [Planctomycetota bacterium]